jgi:hypothetical protein
MSITRKSFMKLQAMLISCFAEMTSMPSNQAASIWIKTNAEKFRSSFIVMG